MNNIENIIFLCLTSGESEAKDFIYSVPVIEAVLYYSLKA